MIFSTIAIALAVLGGGYALYKVVKLAWEWLKEKLREWKLKGEAQKFLVITVQKLIKESQNDISLDELNRLVQIEREGKRHIVVGLDINRDMTGKLRALQSEEVDSKLENALNRGDGVILAE